MLAQDLHSISDYISSLDPLLTHCRESDFLEERTPQKSSAILSVKTLGQGSRPDLFRSHGFWHLGPFNKFAGSWIGEQLPGLPLNPTSKTICTICGADRSQFRAVPRFRSRAL